MLIRTHLAITLFFVLLLFNFADDKLIFVFVSLVATFIPDIDSRFSKIGKKKIARILQLFVEHRGIFHSFTFLFLLIFFLIPFFPVVAFGFFLGYGSHLLADCLTVTGIKPLYPFRFRIKCFLKTGGIIETMIFVGFLAIDIILIGEKFLVYISDFTYFYK